MMPAPKFQNPAAPSRTSICLRAVPLFLFSSYSSSYLPAQVEMASIKATQWIPAASGLSSGLGSELPFKPTGKGTDCLNPEPPLPSLMAQQENNTAAVESSQWNLSSTLRSPLSPASQMKHLALFKFPLYAAHLSALIIPFLRALCCCAVR